MSRSAFRGARTAAALATFLLLASGESTLVFAQGGSALSQYHRGERLYDEGDLAGALAAFRGAYALDPKSHRGERIGMHFEDYDPAFQIGRIRARQGDFEEAQRFFAQCAASGYTERSRNAEEYRRWRAVAEQALAAAARPTEAPQRSAEPPPTRPAPLVVAPAIETPPPAPTATPLVVAVAAVRTMTPRVTRTAPATPSPPPIEEAVGEPTSLPLIAAPHTAPPVSPRRAELPPPGRRQAPATESRSLLPIVLLLLGVAALLFLIWALRRGRRPRPVGEGVVPFGRYAIIGLLGTGRNSYVYEARDGKRRVVALRVRRPDRPGEETGRFSREAAALERTRRLAECASAPRLLGRGLQKTAGGTLEFLALEKLSGTSLLDLSRSARRRIDPTLSVEILHETAVALRHLAGLGLTNDEIAAEDVFLLDPVPTNAGHAIRLKILGLCLGPADSRRYAAALADIAAELFRGRFPTSEHDDWLADHVPSGLARVLVAARQTAGPTGASFEDVEKALRETTGSHRGPS